MSTTRFEGVVGGVRYDEPALFETAARGLGYRSGGKGRSKRPKPWRLGTAVSVLKSGETEAVEGQVWSRGSIDGYMWLALDSGEFVGAHCASGRITAGVGAGQVEIGRLAPRRVE